MNIIEAIKSGKRFKRPKFAQYFEVIGDFILFCGPIGDKYSMSCNSDDLLADDWEVEEEKIEITRDQFFKACEKVPFDFSSDVMKYLKRHATKNLYPSLVEELFRKLGEELGFKE